MNPPIKEAAPEAGAEKRKCCEQSFLGSVAGLQRDEAGEPPGPARRAVGLVILAGVHMHMMAWSAAMAPFVPRYRKVLRWQARFFIDVMGNELKRS